MFQRSSLHQKFQNKLQYRLGGKKATFILDEQEMDLCLADDSTTLKVGQTKVDEAAGFLNIMKKRDLEKERADQNQAILVEKGRPRERVARYSDYYKQIQSTSAQKTKLLMHKLAFLLYSIKTKH